MPQFVTLERPREGVALVTMANPALNNHGSWIGITELAALADRPAKALAALKQILIGNDDLNLTDALANE